MSSLRAQIEARTRTAQRHWISTRPDVTNAHEAGWRQWCLALLDAHFPAFARPSSHKASGPFVTSSSLAASSPLAQFTALAQSLPPSFSARPEGFAWAFEQWQRPEKDAAQRNDDADLGDVAPLTQLFTDASLAQSLLAPCVQDARTMEISSLPTMQILDPCSGASSILLTAFRELLPIFIARLNWSKRHTVEHLIRHTLRGVELDPLCASVGALVLALEVERIARMDVELGADVDTWSDCLSFPSPIANFTDDGALKRDDSAYEVRLQRAFGSIYDPRRHHGEETRAIADNWIGDSVNASDATPFIAHALAQPQPRAVASKWLRRSYTHVCTNVPFLARGKQDEALRAFCALHYPQSRYDLANVFLERCLELADKECGQVLVLMPQNWLFLTSYHAQRRELLTKYRWEHLHFCKEGVFDSAGAAGAFVILLHIDVRPPTSEQMLRMTRDGTEGFGRQSSRTEHAYPQRAFLDAPQARIVWEHQQSDHPPLSNVADAYVGLQTGDDPRYLRAFWELDAPDDATWIPLQGAPTDFAFYDGASWLVRWEQGAGALHSARGARPDQGVHAIGRRGIAIQRMRRIFAYHYEGGRFHQNIAVIIPKKDDDFAAIQAFCHAPAFEAAVRRLDQKLNVTNRTLTEVPFDIEHWREHAQTTEISTPENPHPFRQRHFAGLGPHAFAHHIHLARYLGMRWPQDAPLCARASAPPWYVLLHDAPHAAPQCRSTAWMDAFIHEAESADDLHAVVGDLSRENLARWLRNTFFKEHCALFLQRPFLWHIWDGEPDGFGVIARYHRLDNAGLAELIDGPLASWRATLRQNESCADNNARLRKQKAAERLHVRLSNILAGKPPYDLYIRWKSPDEQAQGWQPDLNDGVRLNLRPFMSEPSFSRKGAGVLRVAPKVSFRNDRGRDPEDGPWAEHNRAEGLHPGTRVNARHRGASGAYAIDERCE